MTIALATGSILAFAGLVVVIVLGHAASDGVGLARHVTLAVFVTLLTLLAHSMTLFYLIGKGRAVREALTEAGLPTGDAVARLAAWRRPVFRLGSLAVGMTMAAAILGGGVDTGAVASWVHTVLSYAALGARGLAVREELVALVRSARLVDEVNCRITTTSA